MNRMFALLLALATTPAFAEVIIEDAYVRGLPPGVDTTSVYMKLRNTGSAPVALTGATTPVAGGAMLHTTMNHGGMLHMQHLASVTVPAGGEYVLESGGTHLMLTGLKQTLKPGQEVELTLHFADGQTYALTAPVRSVLDE